MNKKYKYIIGLYTTIFLILGGVNLFIEKIEIEIGNNLLLALVVTGLVALYGGLLNLAATKQRNL